jgi:hypothetical protein
MEMIIIERSKIMAKEKNECGKARKVGDPYEIWVNEEAGWEWRVLKKYQSPTNEAKNPYARWFCAVKSPYTFGSYDIGDVYVRDIKNYAVRIK